MELIDVLGICGSLRPGSLNRALLLAAQELAPAPFRVQTWDGEAEVPRVHAAMGRPFPPVIGALRDRVAAADVLLLVTPELNRAIPGTMKDIVDWLGILAPPRPLTGKPVVLMSASPNRFGGAFAQLQLGDLLRRSGAEVLSDLDVVVGDAHRQVDDHGVLVGEDPRREITELWQRVLTQIRNDRPAVPA
ncbi:NADPH-dependent FMN reductase [Amycolatopsis viridis]|uniref:Chromate reductase n=1 Tax=Amycolatopsis viridis TaxID=185678 RepID=A0ABX0SU59_9PSEU|nr:NAD(P)H-dependent oxidoreductase [Amycolatopsis viridis]NIH80408.1 chromate reductase [Amycolatopsis viridis]